MSDTPEIVYLIENAEQGGDEVTYAAGVAARKELEAMQERIKALEAARTALQNIVNAHEMYGIVTMQEMNEARAVLAALAVTK